MDVEWENNPRGVLFFLVLAYLKNFNVVHDGSASQLQNIEAASVGT